VSVPYSELLLPDDYRPDPESIEQIARAYQNANSRALANSLIVKATTGLLFGFTAVSTNVAAQFIQLFDRKDVPANTAVPLLSFPVAAENIAAGLWVPGRAFVQGIVIVNSTTQDTLTIGAADTIFDAQFL
jgi:hypothetical protein